MAIETGGGQGPAAVSNTEVLEGLNDLLQLDHDAIGAYEVAIEKLEDRDHASQIAGFKLDHERHIRDLNELIVSLGGTPTNEPHATGPFKQGMQGLAALGGDKGILMAWRTNELQVRKKYDSYASKANFWPEAAKRVIDRNALDEERHYRWVSETLDRMGASAQGGEGPGVVERAKAQASGATAKAQEMVGAARERASGLMDQASPGQLRADVEQRVRTQPLQTMLATFAVGFVIGRLLR